ncbi:MAG: glycogen/starch synthase [Bacteroidota bacterium]|jgi:starch synthase|nr:glycogen/starch synthase [Bacteroidota bacterium]
MRRPVKRRILFISSEITPYLPETPVSEMGRYLPQGIQERKKEIRAFMPRYGCINERKNQLHEVIRLSGMNIIIRDVDRPLIIKVASIPAARIQVYFIDNDDYFKRKQLVFDEDGKFFEDNGERAIFFARGVLETVKKLRWAPDIIHCLGWISSLVPVYLKKVYHGDPIFSNSKIVTSFFDDLTAIAGETFSDTFKSTALLGDMKPSDLSLPDHPTGINLAETAARYSDGILFGAEHVDPELVKYCEGLGVPILPFNEESIRDGSYIDEYDSFYDQL